MATALALSFSPWKLDYQAALRDSTDAVKLNIAVSSCLNARLALAFLHSEYQAITIALSDLLVLRGLHYKYETNR